MAKEEKKAKSTAEANEEQEAQHVIVVKMADNAGSMAVVPGVRGWQGPVLDRDNCCNCDKGGKWDHSTQELKEAPSNPKWANFPGFYFPKRYVKSNKNTICNP